MGKHWCDVEVNGRRWTETDRRAARPCSKCDKPTQGRIEKIPFCMDCGMKEVMLPLKSVGDMIRGFLGGSRG